MTNVIKSIDKNFEDEIVIKKIFRFLPAIFNPKVFSIEEMSDLRTLTMEQFLEYLHLIRFAW